HVVPLPGEQGVGCLYGVGERTAGGVSKRASAAVVHLERRPKAGPVSHGRTRESHRWPDQPAGLGRAATQLAPLVETVALRRPASDYPGWERGQAQRPLVGGPQPAEHQGDVHQVVIEAQGYLPDLIRWFSRRAWAWGGAGRE